MNHELLSLAFLHRMGLTEKALLTLSARYGSYSSVVDRLSDGHSVSGLTDIDYSKIGDDLASIEKLVIANDINVLMRDDYSNPYPDWLRRSIAPPLVLYVMGNIPDRQAFAIVGSRLASHYGLSQAGEISQMLARQGRLIVSGLAYGIDIAAHRSALSVGGLTIAVLGCGLPHVYPMAHRSIADKIISAGGALISQFPLNAPALPHHFPIRNWTIAGLSNAVVVIEAAIKSGSLITARAALESGRDVWAIPGDITRENAWGSNSLIERGAQPLYDHRLFLKYYGIGEEKMTAGELPAELCQFYDLIERQPIHLNQLVAASRLDIAEVSSKVVMLELRGLLRNHGSGYYSRSSTSSQ